MKVTMEFSLPDERCEHNVCVHAMDWALTVLDMDNKLREWLKYGHKFVSADHALETMRNELREAMDTHNVSLDMIE